tara:strand:+ start:1174 stop:2712 length:1539 start_codon:yes stop_codon:yes gene_type:complete
MSRKQLIIIILISLPIFLIVAGIIGALLRLINIQTILITIVFLLIFSKKLRSPSLNKIINKLFGSNGRGPNSYLSIKNKKQAAKYSLESIDGLISKIQNDVVLERFKQEKERVENELSRGDLELVVFGTGSSGKTSLIRALLNKIVGETGPSMGTTSTSSSYRIRLKGLGRGIRITDTPGILEGGIEGRSRENEALMKASRADLMVVVIDSDLRESEFQIIKNLALVGKRLFLVLNKIDLRGVEEEIYLLQKLRDRTRELIEPEDIIATTASPQTIPQPGRRPIQPQPEIDELVKRLAKVLYEDGEELLSDNILIQCRNLGKVGREILNSQREEMARRSIDRYCWISSGVVAITPLPGVEILGTAVVNAQMVIEIAKEYGVQLTKSRAKELAFTVGKTITGLGIVQGGVTVIGSALTLNLPVLIAGRTVQAITAGWLTRVAGESFITYFQQDQDWGDGGIQEVVQRKYNLSRREETLRDFIDKALKRVIEPLSSNQQKRLPYRRRPQREEGA